MKFNKVLDEAYYIINQYDLNAESEVFSKAIRRRKKDKESIKKADKVKKNKKYRRRRV